MCSGHPCVLSPLQLCSILVLPIKMISLFLASCPLLPAAAAALLPAAPDELLLVSPAFSLLK